MARYVSRTSIGNRFMSSIGAVIVGFLLIIGCVLGMVFNEYRSVKMIRALDQVGKIVIDVSSEQVASENDGKLVATNGTLTYDGVATDATYNVESSSFVIKRVVEMRQWKEKKTNSDDEVIYDYERVWSTSRIDSSDFYRSEYSNPAWPDGDQFKSTTSYASNVKLGAFNMSESLLSGLSASTAVNVPSTAIMPYSSYHITSNQLYITNSEDLSNALVGDVRISFTQSTVTTASVLAKQTGNGFTDYTTSNNVKIGRIFAGTHNGQEMVSLLQTENTILTWAFRIVLTILVCVGFALLFTPIHTISGFIPFLGRFLSRLGRGISSLVGGIMGLSLSLLVIAVSWIAVRPVTGIIVLLVVALLVGCVVLIAKRRKIVVE